MKCPECSGKLIKRANQFYECENCGWTGIIKSWY